MRCLMCGLLLGVLANPARSVFPSAEEDTQFPSVGKLGGASAVAISPYWVLTAKHVNGSTFEMPGVGTRNVVENYSHPGADLRAVKLDAPVPYWSPILLQDVPKGQLPSFQERVTIVGFGDNGFVRADGGGYTMIPKDGKRYKTYNMIEGNQVISYSMWAGQQWLCHYVENDNPTTATGVYGKFGWIPGEGGVATGDSGGGWFVKRGDQHYLIAITNARGAAPTGSVWDYGATSFAIALSDNRVRPWLESVIGGRTNRR